MSEVFVERHWDTPPAFADMKRMFENSVGCFEMHSVEWKDSYLSVDNRELFCHFHSPDAESVRIALNQAGSPRGSVWAGTVHDGPRSTEDEIKAANVLVSRSFEQPVAFKDIQALGRAGAGCLETHRVRYVRTFFSIDGRRMICLYHAPDAESVRIAQRQAKMPVDRVWAFRKFNP